MLKEQVMTDCTYLHNICWICATFMLMNLGDSFWNICMIIFTHDVQKSYVHTLCSVRGTLETCGQHSLLAVMCFGGIIPGLDFPVDSCPACWLHCSSLTSVRLHLPVTDSAVCLSAYVRSELSFLLLCSYSHLLTVWMWESWEFV